jgi:hypothetical protein
MQFQNTYLEDFEEQRLAKLSRTEEFSKLLALNEGGLIKAKHGFLLYSDEIEIKDTKEFMLLINSKSLNDSIGFFSPDVTLDDIYIRVDDIYIRVDVIFQGEVMTLEVSPEGTEFIS